MKLDDAELKNALGQWVARQAAERGAHPQPEELADYHTGKLPSADEQRVARHLVLCDDCRELYLEIARFRPTAPSDALAPVVPFGARTAARQPPAPAAFWPWAVAASFLIATLGLGGWVLSLRGTVAELAELGQPQLNAAIVDLYPAGGPRSEAPRPATVELPPEARLFTLILNLPGAPQHDRYRVEIEDRRGAAVWRGEGLAANAYGSLTLILPRRLLPAGEYRVRLFATAPGEGLLVAEYPLSIAGP